MNLFIYSNYFPLLINLLNFPFSLCPTFRLSLSVALSTALPLSSVSLSLSLSLQLLHKSKGAQIFVLNPLIEVGRWAHVCTFQTGREACTWSDLDNPVYHYSILDDLKMWTCLWCTLDNPVGIEECQICGKKGKATRMKGSKKSLR